MADAVTTAEVVRHLASVWQVSNGSSMLHASPCSQLLLKRTQGCMLTLCRWSLAGGSHLEASIAGVCPKHQHQADGCTCAYAVGLSAQSWHSMWALISTFGT